MSDVAIIATPIAPAHPAGRGTSTPGGHIKAFRALPAFPLEATLTVTGGNLWRPGTPGYRFYEEVLGLGTVQTVQEVLDKAAALSEPFSEKAVQGHLRWMYTSAGGFLEVDGEKFVSAPPQVKQPAVVKEAKKAKTDKKAKAVEAA